MTLILRNQQTSWDNTTKSLKSQLQIPAFYIPPKIYILDYVNALLLMMTGQSELKRAQQIKTLAYSL